MPASSTRIIRIAPIGFHSAVGIAADELGHYLHRLAPVVCRVLGPQSYQSKKAGAQIVLGTSEHLNPTGLRNVPAPMSARRLCLAQGLCSDRAHRGC
jgi:hypothetical protein